MSETRVDRFNALVVAHGDELARYFRRRHRDRDATSPEDLVADVLAIAWRKVDDLPVGEELPFLFGIARNVSSNARRRAGRRASIGARLRPSAPSPSAELEAIADLDVRRALETLSPSEREVLLLATFEGLDGAQLATVLGVSINAAAIRLSRAKGHFTEAFNRIGESAPVPVTGAG